MLPTPGPRDQPRSAPDAGRGRRVAGRGERISAGDLTQLATDVGPVAMNVAAVLVLDPAGAPFDVEGARATLAGRAAGIPRLRQRLAPAPAGVARVPGRARPAWLEDADVDALDHIRVQPCPDPADRQALLDLATAEVTRPLPRRLPLWRGILVPGLPDGQVGLILVLHHVLADGIGGLAVLAALADPDPTRTPPSAAASAAASAAPSAAASAESPAGAAVPRATGPQLTAPADRPGTLARALGRTARALGTLGRARTELGLHRIHLAPRCSLNAPTGPRRRVVAVDVDLAGVRDAARRRGATVNDVLLVAVTEAMAEVLADRGEDLTELVVSVPISARGGTTVQQLGNAVGVMPVAVPTRGPMADRLAQVAASTAAQRAAARTGRGASAALVGPAFRALATVGAFRWMVDHQRLVNTFLTNLRGPGQPLHLHAATVRSITPITITAGNVTTAFAALSYAGGLTVSVIADPDRVPEQERVARAVARVLHELADPER